MGKEKKFQNVPLFIRRVDGHSSKRIWQKNLLKTFVGKIFFGVIILCYLGFLLFQGIKGIFMQQALAIGRGGSYKYHGFSAQVLGCSYLILSSLIIYGFWQWKKENTNWKNTGFAMRGRIAFSLKSLKGYGIVLRAFLS